VERDGVKFLCDRCKTRYSIGDDRVRGKILKIRCKNCANVITVREGMTADDDAQRGRPTTAAPLMTVGAAPAAGASNGALASAFAEQLAKPPAALEEEWYVSIEGAQSGPYGLSEAQRWVASKPFDAELHCWSEGFDDWLPVDKVSHFRGLRRKPAAPAAPPLAAPPPMPSMPRTRVPALPATQAAAPVEDEPKPLFAATMASLEKAAPPASSIAPAPPVPTNGASAKANGTGPAMVPRIATSPSGAVPTKTNGTGQSASQAAIAAAFDVSAAGEPAASIEPFKDLRAKAPSAPAPIASHDDGDDGDDGDDNLDIGEVSRVVNLADLARSHAAKSKPNVAAAAPRAASSRPSLGRMTGATPKLDASHLGLDATASIDALPAMPEGLAAAPVVAQAHRRGLIMLIGVAALLLAGVTAALVFMLNKDTDTDESGLGPQTHGIDTSRPEEVVRAHMVPTPGDGSASAAHQQIHRPPPTQPKLGANTPNPTTGPDTPAVGGALKPEEVEDMASKNSTATNRCYMRAQRGEMGMEIGDLKKITVTLVVDKTGAVNDVQLSDHAGDSLGNCLSNQIKRWKFRESAGGQFRFALAFANN
jgi:predicted Zn finger-like uncharacterized protein